MFKNKSLLVISAFVLSIGFFAQNVFAAGILDSITITTPPTKTEYTVGESLDISGLVVTGNYTEGLNTYTENVVVTVGNISGFDSSVPVTGQTLTVTVEGKTATFEIDVVAAPEEVIEEAPEPRRSGSSGGRRVTTTNTTQPAGAVLGATTGPEGEVLGDTTFKFTTYLSIGMSGNDVKELQERLRAEGFFTYETSTGYFGPITLAAVKAYQTAKGIPSTGFVGPLTIAELNK